MNWGKEATGYLYKGRQAGVDREWNTAQGQTSWAECLGRRRQAVRNPLTGVDRQRNIWTGVDRRWILDRKIQGERNVWTEVYWQGNTLDRGRRILDRVRQTGAILGQAS